MQVPRTYLHHTHDVTRPNHHPAKPPTETFGAFFHPSTNLKGFLMLLPIIGFSLASLASLTLLKLGSLLVWVAVLALALKLVLLTIVALTAMLGYSYFKRPRP